MSSPKFYTSSLSTSDAQVSYLAHSTAPSPRQMRMYPYNKENLELMMAKGIPFSPRCHPPSSPSIKGGIAKSPRDSSLSPREPIRKGPKPYEKELIRYSMGLKELAENFRTFLLRFHAKKNAGQPLSERKFSIPVQCILVRDIGERGSDLMKYNFRRNKATFMAAADKIAQEIALSKTSAKSE
jgi:hypothetical protein